MKETRVVNMYAENLVASEHSDHVYIGRAGKGVEGPFGNPHPVGPSCDLCEGRPFHTLEEALHLFYDYFHHRLETDPGFRADVLALTGKTLVCFCKPRPCHGDVIAQWLNEEERKRTLP